jgi:hypothetical protein
MNRFPALPRLHPAPWATAILVCAGLLFAGCAEQRLVVSSDEKMGVVSIISGRDKPEAPPHPALRELTPAMVEGSLRRIWVEPSTWSLFARDDATRYLTPAQTFWARDQISQLLPGLQEDQRIELAFKDQFKQFDVRVEIYPEGNQLVYLFTQLSTESPLDPSSMSMNSPGWVTLVEQPGQVLLFSRKGHTLKDPVIGKVPGEDPRRLEKLERIQQAVREKYIEPEEGKDLAEAVNANPYLQVADFETYLKKRRTLGDALKQGLFSQEEYNTRLKRIRAELAP